MIGFILFSIALLVLIMWLIAPALLSKQNQSIDSPKHINISIARERLTDLEDQLKQGDINQAQYEQARDEIEGALLDDTESQADVASDSIRNELPTNYKRNIFVLLTAIPFIAFGLYQYWGEPQAITNTTLTAATQTDTQSTEEEQHTGSMDDVLAKLEAKLAQNPNDPNGWYILGRTYMVQKQYTKAVEAFQKVRSLAGDQAEILLGLADAMAMARSGDMRGEPFELSKRALELAPNNITALWLTGLGYQSNGDLPAAISLWKKLLPLLAEDPQSSQKVRALIDQAQDQLGATATVTSPTPTLSVVTPTISEASLTVSVQLDSALRTKLADTDYVMVYAQRVEGLKMPLAMVKAQVKDLPMTVTLNDSLALSPMNKLSSEQQVNVIARISKSGQAVKQAGDIEKITGPHPVTLQSPINIILAP